AGGGHRGSPGANTGYCKKPQCPTVVVIVTGPPITPPPTPSCTCANAIYQPTTGQSCCDPSSGSCTQGYGPSGYACYCNNYPISNPICQAQLPSCISKYIAGGSGGNNCFCGSTEWAWAWSNQTDAESCDDFCRASPNLKNKCTWPPKPIKPPPPP